MLKRQIFLFRMLIGFFEISNALLNLVKSLDNDFKSMSGEKAGKNSKTEF